VVTPIIQVRIEDMYEAKNKTDVLVTHEDALHSFQSLDQTSLPKGEAFPYISRSSNHNANGHVNQEADIAVAVVNSEADSNGASNLDDATHE